MKMKLLLVLILVAMRFFCISNSVGAEGMKITNEQAMEIANKEAMRLGYDTKLMDVEIALGNVPWNKFFPKESASEYVRERQNKLKGKEYWAVWYHPSQGIGDLVKGGDVCIFIDSKTGEILTNYRGK
jgi:hypothetical protein